MKFSPSFRLVLFLLAFPFFGFAQQFPVNNQKIVQGVGTTAQGISSYSSSPPTVNPTAATFRHVTSLHMDTVLQVQYIYKRPRWYPISVVRRATPPPATASSGSTTIDYTESIWQSTADSLTYYYEEENACWQPIGTYLSSTTPSDVAATGSTGAICYGYGLWYDPDVDSIYAQQGATWTAIGSGAGGYEDWTAAADSGTPAVISDGETVTFAGGYGINTAMSGNTETTEVDTTQIATQNDISGLPTGTGTNQRIVVWTGTNSQGNSTQLQSAAGVALDANLAYRITGGTTASRPTGAAGMLYYNTNNNWFDLHNGTSWFNPLRSTTTSGTGTGGRIFYAATGTGTASADDVLHWDAGANKLGVGTNSPQGLLHVRGEYVNQFGQFTLQAGTGVGNQAIIYESYYDANGTRLVTYGLGHYASSTDPDYYFANEISGGGINFRTTAANRFTITSTGNAGIGTNAPDRLLHSELSDAVTNAMVFPLRLTHITSGTAAAGSGAGMEFEAESAGGTNRVAGTIENPFTTATNAAEVSDLVFRTMRAGTLTESLRSLGNGTLQIGTLSGTATQLMGATAGNILCPITLGAGLSFSSGTLNGAFLPLTLTGTTEVNTAGQVLRIRDAGAYPDVYMNSNYWTAASDVNTFIDVGSTSGQMQLNSAGRTIIAAATNVELQSGITGEMRFDGDSLVLEGVYPVGTASDSVLVRDASNNRVKLVAQSDMEGVWLKTVLESGNNVDVFAVDQPAFEISDLAGFNILNATDINLEGGNIIELTTNNLTLVGNYPVGSSTDSVLVRDGATGRVNLRAQSDLGTWLKPELEAGNNVSITGDEANELGIFGLRYLGLGVEKGGGDTQRAFIEMSSDDGAGTFGGDTILGSFYGGTYSDVVSAMYLLKSGTTRIKGETEIYLDSPNAETAGAVQVGDITNGDGVTLAAYNSSNVLTSVTIDGTGNSGLLFDDGALTLSNNLSEVADTTTRTLGTGQQIYSNGYSAYLGSGFSYSSGRITNASGATRLCKIRYYFTAETAGLLTDALTIRVMIWDGATYTEHRAGRLTMTLNDDWELTGSKETIITLPDGDGVNIAFDSADGLDVSNFGYVIEKI